MSTRAEVEASIRASKFRCRGKRIFNDAQVADFRERFDGCKTLEEMVTFKESLEKHLKVGVEHVETTEQAHARVANLIYAYPDTVGRAMCGEDVGELIIAGKLDGQEKIIICPRCGERLTCIPAIADEDVAGAEN